MKKEVMMNGENVREAYEAPKCEMIEMQNEGVLCGSGVTNTRWDELQEKDYSSVWD